MEKDFGDHKQKNSVGQQISTDQINQSDPLNAGQQNGCPNKDRDGNCLVPGTYSDSEPIGGG